MHMDKLIFSAFVTYESVYGMIKGYKSIVSQYSSIMRFPIHLASACYSQQLNGNIVWPVQNLFYLIELVNELLERQVVSGLLFTNNKYMKICF